MGMASGYCDTLSTTCDPGTYSLGNADLSMFLCSRAGMMVGAALSVSPTNRAAKFTNSVGSMAVSQLSGAFVAQTERAVLTQFAKSTGKTTVQKTAQVAEKYVARGMSETASKASVFSKDILHPNPLKGTSYNPKVLNQIRLNARSAKPDFHGFPRIVDNYAGLGFTESLIGRDGIARIKISLPGGYQGREGCFEWIIEADKTINHRIFIPK